MRDDRTERVNLGGMFVDQYVLVTKEEAAMTGNDDTPAHHDRGSAHDPGDGHQASGFVTPAHPLPTVEQAEQIFRILGVDFEREGPDPVDERAHLAGALHALTGMWAVYATHTTALKDFNSGWTDAHDGSVPEVLAALAFLAMRNADAARAMNALSEAFLVPLTLAAACGDVATWGFAACSEIAKGDKASDKAVHAACNTMTANLKILYDQAAMMQEMLTLHGQVHDETGGC
jgi:hypothetical protein